MNCDLLSAPHTVTPAEFKIQKDHFIETMWITGRGEEDISVQGQRQLNPSAFQNHLFNLCLFDISEKVFEALELHTSRIRKTIDYFCQPSFLNIVLQLC